MEKPRVQYEAKAGIATLCFAREKVKNAINDAVYLRLIELLDRAERDADVICVVITGAGDYFTSGADLKEVRAATAAAGPNNWKPIAQKPPGLFMRRFMRFPKPIIAAVNGPAVGIGVTLLPHCDIVYAAPSATFWIPFLRLALVPEFCSSVTLREAVGPSKAAEMLLLGRRICAKDAAASGLVSQVLPAEGFLNEVRRKVTEGMLAQPLAAASAPLFKRLLQGPRMAQLEQVLDAEFEALDARFRAGEPQKAVSALFRPASKL